MNEYMKEHPGKDNLPIYLDPDQPLEKRVDDLVSRLTLEEKVSQMIYASSAIPRLGIPEYNWWNECLHGVAAAGIATVFPQAIGMAASFNDKLLYRVACAISDEARAKHHEFVRQGDRGIFKGLTFWSPNINIFRDPRWGRGQETYGEDPYLTGRMGVAFVKGLQGDHPKYLKVVATPKHYAVHSGPEPLRHSFDARVSQKDLRETYLPAFKECVKEGKAESIMGAYNRTNGEPCCASPTLLQKILREEWGFEGYVVSDCGAIDDIHMHHKVTSTPEESAALAVNNGCDLNCGRTFESLVNAVKQGLVSEETIDRAVKRLFRARFKLGMFDPLERVPYAQIPYEVNDCEEHRKLALEMARESMVLLKNEGGLLPLRKDLKAIAVIGPNADNKKVLLGNYNGMPSKYVTALEGIRAKVSPHTRVYYAQGCDLTNTEDTHWGPRATAGFAEALAAAQRADVVIMCLGLSPDLEGEEGNAPKSAAGGDRVSLDLPGMQEELLKAVCATGKPVVLVLFSGSPVSINWAHENVPAILQAWYPGEEGGTAIADVLFGDYNPGGRLPVTFVKSVEQLPPFTDYSMKGRTYRYMEDEPLYPFGYGLSYTTFEYSNLRLSAEVIEAGQSLTVSVDVKNTGKMAGDEVVQLYLKDLEASVDVPIHELKGFTRVKLQPGESTTVTFTLTPRQMALIDNDGRCILEPGKFRVMVGGRQPDKRSEVLAGSTILIGEFEVVGEMMELEY
ncbi:beta-glucosidase [Caldicoprobacter guelmensis]|uniref:glycoside hydrolase family 3 C-terminal domain-containing protein n=1 Tax=Caldicoprobacter guelmensis TaxID=1170224 RepID=UPI001FAF6AC7|nr:glycoside hydrolase family 3 C-terminal domain-containing protein [Caldicoprobacter guelmensis]MBM7582102.1 beta-glucosidase [Caldicoprobacter guelmensis]